MSASLDIAAACDRAGRSLQGTYGDRIPADAIIAAVVADCGCKPGSVLPWDHCYNRTNKGIKLANAPVFEYVETSLFRYVGPNYPYTGELWHYPKGGSPRVVGYWAAGQLTFTG